MKYAGEQAVAQVEKLYGKQLNKFERSIVMKEGYSDTPYEDTNGVMTSGVGQTGEFMNMPFPEVVTKHINRAKSKIPDYEGFPEDMQMALFSSEYRGDNNPSHDWMKALNNGDYESAAKHFVDSDELRTSDKDGTGVGNRMRETASVFNDFAKTIKQPPSKSTIQKKFSEQFNPQGTASSVPAAEGNSNMPDNNQKISDMFPDPSRPRNFFENKLNQRNAQVNTPNVTTNNTQPSYAEQLNSGLQKNGSFISEAAKGYKNRITQGLDRDMDYLGRIFGGRKNGGAGSEAYKASQLAENSGVSIQDMIEQEIANRQTRTDMARDLDGSNTAATQMDQVTAQNVNPSYILNTEQNQIQYPLNPEINDAATALDRESISAQLQPNPLTQGGSESFEGFDADAFIKNSYNNYDGAQGIADMNGVGSPERLRGDIPTAGSEEMFMDNFSQENMFGKNGWLSGGAKVVGDVAGAWAGMQQYKLGRDSFEHNKNLGITGHNNQVDLINKEVAAQANAAADTYGSSVAGTAKKNGTGQRAVKDLKLGRMGGG